MRYTVEYTPRAVEDLKKLTPQAANLVYSWTEKNLVDCQDPRALGSGRKRGGRWRYRIGAYRLVCEIEEARIVVLAVTSGVEDPSGTYDRRGRAKRRAPSVFLKSTARQPVKAAALLIVTALLTFAFVSRGAEWLLLTQEAERLAPYTPGEQPTDLQYVKLNTNESPFPPSPRVIKAVTRAELLKLNLYSDPTCAALDGAVAAYYELRPENVLTGNGSDEILAFAFRAFCGQGKPVAFADITYSFYHAQTALFGLEKQIVPLREDFSLHVEDYMDFPGTIVIANPNAPTGMAVPRTDIQRLLEADPNRVVIVDEAYVDFGGESCVPMIFRYDNLLVVQTMSKSRSLAGGRVGFALGSPALIDALNRVKYSFNPYNVNRLSIAAGTAAMEDAAYFETCRGAILRNRGWLTGELEALGFTVLPSAANFVFAKSDRVSGGELYRQLKENGVLVRWFDKERIRDYVRITVGSMEQLVSFIDETAKILDAV